MKRLKPYFDSLKLHPSQIDIFAASVGMHILTPLFTFSIFSMIREASVFLNICLQGLLSISYIIFAVKNRKKMKTDYVSVMTFVSSFMIELSLMVCCFVLAVSDISIWVLYLLMLAFFIVGCFIAYIIAVRYVSGKSSNILPIIVITAGGIGGTSYYFKRFIFFNSNNIFFGILGIIYCCILAGGVTFMVIGKSCTKNTTVSDEYENY